MLIFCTKFSGMWYTETLWSTEFLIALSCQLISQEISALTHVNKMYNFFLSDASLFCKTLRRAFFKIDLQRAKQRVIRAAADRAAMKIQLAAMLRGNRLLVRQLHRHHHQLQQAIDNRDNLRERVSFAEERAQYSYKRVPASTPRTATNQGREKAAD